MKPFCGALHAVFAGSVCPRWSLAALSNLPHLSDLCTSLDTTSPVVTDWYDKTTNAALCGCPIYFTLSCFQIMNAEKIASGEKKPPGYFAPDEEFPLGDEDEFEDVTVSIVLYSPLL